jgi:hypothetical protein
VRSTKKKRNARWIARAFLGKAPGADTRPLDSMMIHCRSDLPSIPPMTIVTAQRAIKWK